MPTGCGKTATFTHIPRHGRVLVLAHREELVRQPARYYDCPVGFEIAQDRSHGEEVVIASVQSLVNRLDRFSPGEFDMIITDECFPAGTLIDGKPIEGITVGDFVSSYNHATKKIEKREVKRIFKNPAPGVMVSINGVICTPNHPFYDARKDRYIEAKDLKPGDCILHRVRERTLLDESDKAPEKCIQEDRQSVLLPGMFDGVLQKDFLFYDQSLCELTADTMTFEFYDHEGRNFLPQQNQKVELIKNGELLAVQYITGSTRKAKANYTIKCQSAIGLLTDQFLGGLYVDKPVPELVAEILNRWDHEIASVFTGMTVTGYLPVCTQRDALQQVAFAIGAMVTTQGSSLIRLVPLPASVTSRFLAKDIFLGGKVDSSPRFARVEINSHSYTPTDDVETLLDEEEVEGTDVLLTFTTPHHSYEITGGTITASDVNWVTVTASGPVTLTAKTYLHATRVHTKRNLEATAKERGNYVAVTECTLINAGNVQSALDRLYSAKQRRQKATYQAAVTNQRTGEIGSGITPWNTTTTGFISSMESTLTQTGHMATVEIQGTETVAESVWFYSGEIYSGGQEVVY